MGLDGISINQLRVTPESNSSELNNQARFSLNNDTRIVDGLSEGQRVDPDKERERNNQTLKKHYTSLGENAEEENEETTIDETVEKYDLSQADKYILKLDENEDNILIIEKATKKVIQKIDAKELSKFVNYLSGPTGSIINRKY